MKRRNLSSAVFLALFSLFFWSQVLELSVGSPAVPGTGFWPLILAVLLSIATLAYFVKALRDPSAKTQAFFSRAGAWKHIVLSLGALFLFVCAFQRLGFILSTFLLILTLLRTLKPQRWLIAVGTACVTAVVSYLLFGVLLGIDLPAGLFRSS